MLSQQKTTELIAYWLDSSKEKLKTMESLYKAKRYPDCLFFGHLILEKSLKAMVVARTHEHAPYIHNLSRLADLAGMELSKPTKDLLAQVSEFNLATRYPDVRMDFYRICTKRYVDQFYKPIIVLHREICQNVKQQPSLKHTPKR